MTETIITKKVYQAFDGVTFETPEKCLEYERHHDIEQQYYEIAKSLLMYSANFERTCDVENVAWLYLKDQDEVKNFINLCDVKDSTREGIEDPGLYFFDNITVKYQTFSNIFESMKNFVNEIAEKK